MTPALIPVVISKKYADAIDVAVFELSAPEGQSLPPFSAGSHVDVYIRDGLVRQYSLCNDPAECHRYVIAVLRSADSRGGSRALHELAEVGMPLRISEPKNHFALAPAVPHSLLLAGGIGITPVLCMAERLATTSASFELHYCARSRTRAAFLKRIVASSFSDRASCYFDDEPGRPFAVDNVLARTRVDAHLYVCGPVPFMRQAVRAARARGFADSQIHFELFAAEPAPAAAPACEFRIKIASTGHVYPIPPDLAVVDALAQYGIDIPVSCCQGVCGTCITRILEGIPDHRDSFLTDQEHARNDQFTPCCSRSKSSLLVLDI